MLHVFSINRVKLVTRTPMTTDIKGRREYVHRLPLSCLHFMAYRRLGHLKMGISPGEKTWTILGIEPAAGHLHTVKRTDRARQAWQLSTLYIHKKD
jgi:hypothetical protein